MADTIRSIQELNSLLADNDTNNISAQEIRDLMVSMMVHAEIGSTGQVLETLGAGWQPVKLDVDGAFKRGADTDVVNHRIINIPVDMKVMLDLEIVFFGTDAANFEFTVFKNADTTPVQLSRFNRTLTGAGTVRVQHSWSSGISLDANDTIQMAVRSNGNDFQLDFGRLALRRIGVE